MAASSHLSRTLDHYRLLLLLGEGGMGEVWAARDLAAPGQRIVALKTTKQEGQEAAMVLFDEARIASLIDHPNVCRVHELGRADGLQYLVMDWCDGASLFDLLQAQPSKAISLGVAVKIIADVALGLHAAHELVDEAGNSLHVVHRDVSPQNILVSAQGHVSITDFGVAKARGQVHQATMTGEVKGKLSYMAPEQVRTKHIDRRADVFALGCVLYLATLGKRPFAGGDTIALMYQILEARIQLPREIDPAFPESLEKLLMRSLAKDPGDRFATTLEFNDALERWLRAEDRRVTEKDIALLLDHSLGAKIGPRNAKIRALDQDESTATESVEKTIDDSVLAGPAASVTGATGTLTRTALESSIPPRLGRPPWPWIAGAALVSLGLVVLFRATSPASEVVHPRENVVTASAASLIPGPDAAPQARQVHFSLQVTPVEARVLLDGSEVGRGGYQHEGPAATLPRRLVIEAPGYMRVERQIVLDHDQEVALAMDRDLLAVRVKKPAAAQRRGEPRPSQPDRSEPLSKTPPKKARAIDTDDPFSGGT